MAKRNRSEEELFYADAPRDLGARRESLECRLEDGYVRIDEALIAGADVAEWESFWLRLLREYEDVCRELDVAA